MARPLRIELAGGLYHVTSRGNGRCDIYLDDDDRSNWLALFNDVCSRFNWICHAYCLMSNHYHIVVETVEGNLSKGMRQLNGVYTQNFNRCHKRLGHVFQGMNLCFLSVLPFDPMLPCASPLPPNPLDQLTKAPCGSNLPYPGTRFDALKR